MVEYTLNITNDTGKRERQLRFATSCQPGKKGDPTMNVSIYSGLLFLKGSQTICLSSVQVIAYTADVENSIQIKWRDEYFIAAGKKDSKPALSLK